MVTVYKIHPAIGIARVGNSPDDFFIGPEKLGEELKPPGGFKDDQCRIKRQAARFYIFAHHDDGTVTEISNAQAEISWTVHLVNSKAERIQAVAILKQPAILLSTLEHEHLMGQINAVFSTPERSSFPVHQ